MINVQQNYVLQILVFLLYSVRKIKKKPLSAIAPQQFLILQICNL